MKIGMKLMVILSIINIIGIGLLIGATTFLTKGEIEELAYTNVRNIALEEGRDIQNWIETYIDAARTLAQIMQKAEELDPAVRRSTFDTMLRGLVDANPEILGVWTIWEPNALDGMDAVYADTAGTDRSGRYIPWWVRSGGDIIVQACVEYEDADYYQYPLTTGNEMITDPTYWDINGKPTLMTDLVVPVKIGGKVVGTVGVDIEISVIQSKALTISPYKGSAAAVFSNEGTVVAHFDPARITQSMRATEAVEAGPYLDDFVRAVMNGEPYFFRNRVASSQVDMFFTSVPFAIGKTAKPWSLCIGVPASVVMDPVYRTLVISLAIGVLTIALMSVGAVIIARSISRPIAHTMTVLKDIAEGDLTKTITIHSKDELSDLARYLNFTVEKIKSLVLSIRKETDQLSQTGAELSVHVSETAAATNEIAANVQSVTAQSGKQEASVKNTGVSVRAIAENIETLNVQIQKQTDNISQSSSAVEEMLANIQSVTRTLIASEGNFRKLSETSEIGRSGLVEVSGAIGEIAKESEGLSEINSVMQTIASQTNLLSMNAAIEAAHAGEAGKGFAVVASEIRKLAESASGQSKTISEVLKKIQGSIDRITKSTEETLLKFEAIGEEVKAVTEQEANVRSAMEEQGIGSRSILESISSLNEITREVTEGANAMGSGSREVMKESGALEDVAEEINRGMREMAAGAEQISRAMSRVSDISAENGRQIETLMAEVSRFKVE